LIFHGNQETAHEIWNSWSNVLSLETSEMGKAISAIGWASGNAFRSHIKQNFLSADYDVSSLLVWMITFPAVYYIATNTLSAFKKREDDFTCRHKTALSSVLIFQLLCLVPMFTVLSVDYIRVFFYGIASSFVIFLLMPTEKIESLFPNFFSRAVKHLNDAMARVVPPSKTNLALLILLIGITPVGFSITRAFNTTMLGNILYLFSFPLVQMKPLLAYFGF
jgi:hypothetical protein